MSTKDELIQSGDVVARRNGARLVLTSYSPLITTEQELYDFCEVDIDDWQVEKLYVNAWTTPSKDKESDLTFEAGVVTGTVRQSNEMRFGQNIQVKVTLIPKVIKPIHPMIQPIQFVGAIKKPKLPKRDDFVRHFVGGDHHFGFVRDVPDAKLTPLHDRAALDVATQIMAYCKPNRVDWLGDTFDLAEFGKYLKEPKFYFTLQPALYEAFFWFKQWSELCERQRLHQGNHDKRLPDAIKQYFPFAYGLRVAELDLVDAEPVLSIQNLLSLDALGIEWVDKYPNDADRIADDLILNHGIIARSGPIETANAVARGQVSEIFGHIHKRQYATGVRTDGQMNQYEVIGFSPGCLCHTDFRVPGHSRNQEWSQGVAVVDVFADGRFSVAPIAIHNGVAVYDGHRFVARERVGELRERRSRWNW